MAAPFVAFAQNKVNLGVAIPSADHGFTGGIVWWANEAKKELEKKYPDLKVTVKTSKDAGEQANQLQDLVTANKINALVIFPHESAALTKPQLEVLASHLTVGETYFFREKKMFDALAGTFLPELMRTRRGSERRRR